MFEELRATKIFKTNKQKRPISFTQKSHSIKLFRSRKQGYFVKIKNWVAEVHQFYSKETLGKMLERQKTKNP